MDLSSLRRAYTGHVPDLMGARGGSAVLVPLVDTADGPSLLYEIRSGSPMRSASPAARPNPAKRRCSAPCGRHGRS